MPCTDIIKCRYDGLTAAEKRIADNILGAPAETVDMSVSELAAVAHTAPSAIVRFCRSIGFDGFRRFKLELAKELGRTGSVSMLPVVMEENSVAGAFSKTFGNCISALNDTLSMLDEASVKRAADAVVRADRICLFGVGTSAVVVEDAQYRFMQLGKTSLFSNDVLFMNVQAVNLTPNDLAIAVSHSGRTSETVEALKLARDSGAATLAVTSFPDSPVTEYADITLSVFSDEESSPVEAVAARIAHICVLDALCATLMISDRKNAEKRLGRRDAVLDKLRGEL